MKTYYKAVIVFDRKSDITTDFGASGDALIRQGCDTIIVPAEDFLDMLDALRLWFLGNYEEQPAEEQE